MASARSGPKKPLVWMFLLVVHISIDQQKPLVWMFLLIVHISIDQHLLYITRKQICCQLYLPGYGREVLMPAILLLAGH